MVNREPDPEDERKLRVLFVDDDPLVGRAIGRFLAEHGIEVAAVASEERALAMLAAGPYDVVLCDYNLGPRHTSAALVGQLRSEGWPVAVVTGDPPAAEADAALEGVVVMAKADIPAVLGWLKAQNRGPGGPVKKSHPRLKARSPDSAADPCALGSRHAVEAPAAPRSATPAELAADRQMELPAAGSRFPAQAEPRSAPTRKAHEARRSFPGSSPRPTWLWFGAGLLVGALAGAAGTLAMLWSQL